MRTLVVGAGVSGTAAARLAVRLGHRVVVYDRKPISEPVGLPSVVGEWDPLVLEGIDLVVVSPGIPERAAPITDTLEAGIELVSEPEFAWRQFHLPTVGVTGTNGKTTVTGLVSDMLTRSGYSAPAIGNIGTPVSDLVGSDIDVLVMELSSFQLRFTERLRCNAAVITNVAEDHLDWHGSVSGYREAKARIVACQEPEDTVTYDASDDGATSIARRSAARKVGVGTAGGGDVGVRGRMLDLGGVSIPLDRIGVDDPAYLADLGMAGVAALAVGAAPEAVVDTVVHFAPGAHRRTLVAEIDGVRYVDDSKATNPHAALASIAAFESVVLIAGGQAKGLDVSVLAGAPGVRAVVAMGEAADDLLAAAGDRGYRASSIDEAVAIARGLAAAGDVVLLAPGGASYDMFENYGARGDAFATAVLMGER